MKTWTTLPTQTGRAENAAMLEPRPKGPYCLVYQHDCEKFEKDPDHYQGLIRLRAFEVRFGYATYCVGPDFRPMKCGYHYDTSD